MNVAQFTRRRFLSSIGAVSAFSAVSLAMPYYARGSNRPLFTSGVQSGDVDALTGVVWTRTDRPARLNLEWLTDGKDALHQSKQAPAPTALNR